MPSTEQIAQIDAQMTQAQSFITQGNEEAAKEIYENIISSEPDFMPAIFQLGVMAMAQYDMPQAIYYLEQANKLAPNQVIVMSALGTAYKDAGDFQNAYPLLKATVEQSPSAQSHYHFAHLCALTLKFDEAITHYQKTIEHDPHHVLAFASLAQCKTWSANDTTFIDQIATCDTEISTATALPRATLKFAYAKVLDDIKQFPDAFTQLELAHQLKQQSQPLPDRWIEQHQQNTEDMIKYMTPCKMNKAEGFRSDAKNLIFITGMPASGTGDAQMILGAHEDTFDLGETSLFQDLIPFDTAPADADSLRAQLNHIMTGDAVQKIGTDYLAKVTEMHGDNTTYIDSLPFNFFWIGLVKIVFPHAKIIHCRRNFLDVGLNIFQRDEAAPYVWMHQLDTIAAMINSSEQLHRHWQKLYGNDIFTLQYEKLAENSEATAKELHEYCGLPWSDHDRFKNMSFSTDLWQNYAQELKPLADKIHGY